MKILSLAILLATVAVAVAERGFMLTGPKTLMTNTVETFCVSFQELTAGANCTIDLVNYDGDRVFASSEYRIEGSKGCFPLAVPSIDDVWWGRIRLRAQFDGVDDYRVDSSKEVWFSRRDFIHLIQTDKAWYTPGQLVRFRVLSLDHKLLPLLGPIDRIWVENPSGTVIAQWTDAKASGGIHQMELQLAKEPEQGLWSIKMERGGQSSSREFEVREFVLPRFEVVLNPPPFVRFNAPNETTVQKISLGICAKYSYGQPVRGTWYASIGVQTRKSFWYHHWSRYRRDSPIYIPDQITLEPTIEKSGPLSGDCYNLKLSGEELALANSSANNSFIGTRKTITVVVTVKEEGTGIESNKTWTTNVEHASLTLEVPSYESTFQYGLPYNGHLKVKTADGAPAADISVQFCAKPKLIEKDDDLDNDDYNNMSSEDEDKSVTTPNCTTLTSNPDGILQFQLFTADKRITAYNIKATVMDSKSPRPYIQNMVVNAAYSPSSSFLSFVPSKQAALDCNSTTTLKLHYTATENVNFDLNYVVMSRGDVVSTGTKRVEFRIGDKVQFDFGENLLNKPDSPGYLQEESTAPLVGSFEFDLEVVAQWSPKVSVLAYYIRHDGEVVTASTQIAVKDCFSNPVRLMWSAKRKLPGQKVTMNLQSAPGSICGYSVVDKSVTFTRPDLQLSPSSIFNRLPDFHIDYWSGPRQVVSDYQYCKQEEIQYEERPEYYTYTKTQHKDAMDEFDKSGLMVMSDLKIQTRPCYKKRYLPYYTRRMGAGPMPIADENRMQAFDSDGLPEMLAQALPDSYEGATAPAAVTVRSYFPETWLWDLTTLDSRGEMKKDLEIPHTITTWVGSALCVSKEQGVGMSDPSSIEAFQPFFLEVHLPYSVKREEKLQIKVSVFNYLSYDIPIKLTFEKSKSFKLFVGSNSVQFCVPARNSVVHQFGMYALELGSRNVTVTAVIDDSFPGACGPETLPSGRDTVIKELNVKPEGFPIERVYSRMVCPKEYDEDKMLLSDMALPSDLVEGSARAWVTAVGDVMGPTLQGLSSLVRLPCGCGEQNMVLFTPNIFVVRYLEATNQLTASIKDKAVGFMTSGYQRQLKYRHNDGSYSAFGPRDASGSLWLTAFVVKSFAAARRYVHIDSNNLEKSVEWLQSKQLENGCFPIVGTVFSSYMKGGVGGSDNELAPLTAYTLVSLLEMYASNSSTVPEKLLQDALLCLKVDEGEKRDLYTTALTAYALTLAGKTDGARQSINWLLGQARKDSRSLWWEKPGSGMSLNVELTSYVLLSLVQLKTKQDLLDASSIIRWLSKQRNSEGGFISTQDTVVALQAMSEYATVIGTEEVDVEMKIVAGKFEKSLRVKEKDRLVQRRVELPSPMAPSVAITSVDKSSGCAIVQTTLRYNVHSAPKSAAFDLKLTTSPVAQGFCGARKLSICSEYLLSKSSNMALVEIAMISGFEVDKSSLDDLIIKQVGVKRYEVNDDNVVLYFDAIQSGSQSCVDVVVQPVFQVEATKDSNIKIYDYYHTEHSMSLSYNLSSNGEHC